MSQKDIEPVLLVVMVMSLMLTVQGNFSNQSYAQTSRMEGEDKMEHEEGSNVQNGVSSAGRHVNVTQPVEKITKNLSLSSLREEGSPVLGETSAPITIVQFGDFQCRFCGRFARDTVSPVNQTYIQTGKVDLVFKHFVTHGPDSMTAAMASQCANEQGKFWSFYKILYGNQGEENSGWASANNLKKFASQIYGLDSQKFNSCLNSQKYKSFVENDTAFAIASGYQGTPTFIIEKSDGSNPEVLLGAYPFPSFQAIIDKKISGS